MDKELFKHITGLEYKDRMLNNIYSSTTVITIENLYKLYETFLKELGLEILIQYKHESVTIFIHRDKDLVLQHTGYDGKEECLFEAMEILKYKGLI